MKDYKGSREAVTMALLELVEQDPHFMLVSADSLKAMRATEFAERFPDRYIEVGIAEQNAMAVSAGLASCGLIPYVASYCGFLTMRACEQLRTFVAYPHLNVRIVGINGGLYGGEREGVTHQFFEDLGIVSSIPGITVVTPADESQVYQAVKATATLEGPVYIRCGSGREPVVFDRNEPFVFGKLHMVKEYGSDAAIFASGFLMKRAIAAAEQMNGEGVHVTLCDVHTLKPLDEVGTAAILSRCGAAVTVEDHNIIGGLGSQITDAAASLCPVPVEKIGLRDIFPSSGEAEALVDYYGMSVEDIKTAVRKVVARKQ